MVGVSEIMVTDRVGVNFLSLPIISDLVSQGESTKKERKKNLCFKAAKSQRKFAEKLWQGHATVHQTVRSNPSQRKGMEKTKQKKQQIK